MIIRIKRKLLRRVTYVLVSLLVIVSILLGLPFATNSVLGINVTNATVIARVNVSNTEPTLYLVRITSPTSPPIDLTANGVTILACNGSVQDLNGFTDIKNVSATLYDITIASNAADDNNNHYSNLSCGNCTAIPDSNNQNGSCVCQFAVQYYANPTTWQCNMTINDSGGISSIQNSSFFTINEVLGINVENSILDYGNLSVSQISNYIRENVTNGGNIPINITVRGFGGSDESIGQNLSMICEAGTNITFGNQRFYPGNNTAFGDMYNLTNQTRQIFNLTLPQRTTDVGFGNSSNATFWRLQIPIGASGICNGTIIFGAIDATIT